MLDDPATKTDGGEAGSTGALYVIKPTDTDGEILSHIALNGRCFGTPVAYNGKIYIQAGAGLVADSDPTSEYQETVNKAKALLRAVEATMTRLVADAATSVGPAPKISI